MPAWQAPARSEHVLSAVKQLVHTSAEFRSTSPLQSSFHFQRAFASQPALPPKQAQLLHRVPSALPAQADSPSARGRLLGHATKRRDGTAVKRPERGINKEYKGTKTFRFSRIRQPLSRSPADVSAAILSQLQSLDYANENNIPGSLPLSLITELDSEGKSWASFKADVKKLLRRIAASDSPQQLDANQRNLWQRLWEAQVPHRRSNLTPRAEVAKVLEHAYLDQLLSRKTDSSNRLYNPAEEYTDLRYPTEWYASTRTTQRQIHLHVGPTNSGKTYNALKRLEESGDGFYCGPLRLLAHEVYARFQAKNIPCHLVTGDDVRRDPADTVKLESSTVEMVNTNTRVEVAVIDEIQMMAHEERGWAWTRAFLGANAKEVHLCGETRVVPLVRELAASIGDSLTIHNYERLSPLKVMSKSLKGDLSLLRKGDCVVSFSILGIHALKKEIEKKTGKRVAIVYGSLPPQTRTTQAELFNEPNNDYDFLVASDAIGMGLNLAIKRIIFETVYQYNGKSQVVLSVSQIKQIAGRAGRFRTAKQGSEDDQDAKSNKVHVKAQNVGLVTCMEEVDLPIIREALGTEASPIKAAGLLPPAEYVEEFASRLPKGLPFEYIYRRICDVAKVHSRFMISDISQQLNIARVLDNIPDLRVPDRMIFAASPADTRRGQHISLLTSLGKLVAEGKPVTCVEIAEIELEVLDQPMSGQREYLLGLENLHKSLVLYLWLSYRFVGIFKDQAQAMHAKYLTEQRINETLVKFSHVAELKERLRLIKLRQVKESQLLAQFDPPSLIGEETSVLSEKEPITADTPFEPPILKSESENEDVRLDSAKTFEGWGTRIEQTASPTAEAAMIPWSISEDLDIADDMAAGVSDTPVVQSPPVLHDSSEQLQATRNA